MATNPQLMTNRVAENVPVVMTRMKMLTWTRLYVLTQTLQATFVLVTDHEDSNTIYFQ